ncbi:MAG: hypothetical protein ACI8S6_002184 [Myxococcota bacterium]|jgi:hypothetical protein
MGGVFPVGWVKLRLSRPIDGEIRSVTVSRDGKHWFVSVPQRPVRRRALGDVRRSEPALPPAPFAAPVKREPWVSEQIRLF